MARVVKESVWFVFSFVVAVVLFLAVGTVSLVLMSRMDTEVADLQYNSLPSVTRLSASLATLTHMDMLVADLPSASSTGRSATLDEIHQDRKKLDSDVRAYSLIPRYPGEKELYEDGLLPALARLDSAIDRLSGPTTEARSSARNETLITTDAVGLTLTKLLDINHNQSTAATARFAAKRKVVISTAMIMNALTVLICGLLGGIATSAIRRVRRLQDKQMAMAEDRAHELEQFAARVAHDLLSPLSAVSMSMTLIERRMGDEDIRRAAARARHAIERSNGVVQGIFQFSRAGGHPTPGARANLPTSVLSAVDALRDSPDAPEIAVEAVDDCDVACESEVLAVVLGNLLENASKYTKASPVRQVFIRANRLPNERAHLEIEDTGPGIRPGMEREIFEPYKRASKTQPGLGLGLATVRRFVVAHGGDVGVCPSKRGSGSVFWFELPLAGEPPSPEIPLPVPLPADHGELRTEH